MNLRSFKRAARYLSATPLHPQWLMHGDKERFLAGIAAGLSGTVLDIGCADKSTATYLGGGVDYIGLDYYLTASLYGTRPDVYARAEKLPFAGGSINVVLLLDVLEHVEDPAACMAEIARVLPPGGKLVLNVPFLYPIHDAPHDYQRWTRHGLQSLLSRHGLAVVSESVHGNPLTTAGLLLNLALCRLGLAALARRHPGMLLLLLLPLLVPVINITAYFAGLILPPDDAMPYRYHLLASRQGSGDRDAG